MAAAGALAQAASGLGQAIYGNLINQAGSNIQNVVSQRAADERQKRALQFGREQLEVSRGHLGVAQASQLVQADAQKLSRQAWERDWQATTSAGLYHPSQFGQLGAQAMVGRSYGRNLVQTLRAPKGSTFR